MVTVIGSSYLPLGMLTHSEEIHGLDGSVLQAHTRTQQPEIQRLAGIWRTTGV